MWYTLNWLKSLYLQFLQITWRIFEQKDLIKPDSFGTLVHIFVRSSFALCDYDQILIKSGLFYPHS